MKVFIIANDPKTIRFLTNATGAYARQKFVSVDTVVFKKMRDYLLTFETPDLIFIDDNFEMKPSVENARLVRTKDMKAAVVLLSTNPERVFEAFSVKAHRFLMKPVTQADVFDAIDAYRKELYTYRVIIARTATGFRVFSSEEIFALIAEGNHTKIMTKDEVVEVMTNFAQLEEQVPSEYFYKCHRAYIVNMKHIATFDSEQVEMANKAVVPISRRRKLDFHVRYTEFIKGHTFKE
ncbi:MAG: response regulator transcription factor [Clostridia bacterium]|nr:response regulator transcription factor [Clostridia bacterium]